MNVDVELNNKIKKFYDDIKFPGVYNKQQIDLWNPRNNNLYLQFMDKYLTDHQNVIDVGCGSGLITNIFAQQYQSQFTAVDFSTSIQIGKDYSIQHKLKNTNWIQSDFLSIDIDQKFDVVICQGVLHHMPQHDIVLKKLKSLIKPNGIMLLGVYNPLGKILKKIFNISYKSDILCLDQECNPYEVSFLSSEIIKKCLPLEFLEAVPGGKSKHACDFLSLFNSRNGGLTLYAFKNHD